MIIDCTTPSIKTVAVYFYNHNPSNTMKELEIFQSLNLALISNAIYTLAVFFMVWVSFRMARSVRDEGAGIVPKILSSLFGLGVVFNGLLLSGFMRFNIASTAGNLQVLKASGEKLSPTAEMFLTIPMVASSDAAFSMIPSPVMAIWWLVVVLLILGINWLPTKK